MSGVPDGRSLAGCRTSVLWQLGQAVTLKSEGCNGSGQPGVVGFVERCLEPPVLGIEPAHISEREATLRLRRSSMPGRLLSSATELDTNNNSHNGVIPSQGLRNPGQVP